ncbi:MAG: hypothetical protein HKN46_08925 [Acidimicrobiia bacterium]|nr:hypothetical protein [Acidimicrobiia bacterium]
MPFTDGVADFRSDTVTRPTPAMRRAMADAEVGDDVYAEDPTVNLLEEEAAAVTGKEAAVFVPSGSMGNQLGIWVQTRPGDEVICVEDAHIRNYELGAGAIVSNVQFRTIATSDGAMSADDIRRAASGSSYHLPRLGLLAWENSHLGSGGRVVPLAAMQAGRAIADEFGLRVHLDGARLFNTVAASGIAASDWGAAVDTVQFCFSKGLGAPVGSVLCGPADVIDEARWRRKVLGGGMRQVGVLAAPARIALAERERLAEDNALATALAGGLADRFPGAVDAATVETNIVLVDESALPFGEGVLVPALGAEGVLLGDLRPGVLRFVTHRDVDRSDVQRVFDVVDRLGNG